MVAQLSEFKLSLNLSFLSTAYFKDHWIFRHFKDLKWRYRILVCIGWKKKLSLGRAYAFWCQCLLINLDLTLISNPIWHSYSLFDFWPLWLFKSDRTFNYKTWIWNACFCYVFSYFVFILDLIALQVQVYGSLTSY